MIHTMRDDVGIAETASSRGSMGAHRARAQPHRNRALTDLFDGHMPVPKPLWLLAVRPGRRLACIGNSATPPIPLTPEEFGFHLGFRNPAMAKFLAKKLDFLEKAPCSLR